MNNKIALIDYGKNKELISSYNKLKDELLNSGFDVYAMIYEEKKSKKIDDELIRYTSDDKMKFFNKFLKDILTKLNKPNPKKIIVISEDNQLLNAFQYYNINTCMLLRFSENSYDLLFSFDSPQFEKVKEKIKSN